MKRGHRHRLLRTLWVQPPGWAQRGAGSTGIIGTKLGLWGPNPTSANSRGGRWWPGAAGWAGTWGRGGSWQRLRFPGVTWKLVPRNSALTGLSTHKLNAEAGLGPHRAPSLLFSVCPVQANHLPSLWCLLASLIGLRISRAAFWAAHCSPRCAVGGFGPGSLPAWASHPSKVLHLFLVRDGGWSLSNDRAARACFWRH